MVGRPAWCHILGEKKVSTRSPDPVDATACPYDQGVDFGYWNGELAVADDTQVWMIPVRQVFKLMF